MRKSIFMMMAVMAISLFAIACNSDDDKTIAFNALPQTAQTFVNTHFGDKKVVAVYFDKDQAGNEYTVIFTDGANIDFNANGEWDEVEDRDADGVPTAIIPVAIRTYVTINHSDLYVVKISKETTGYDVELNNGLDLEFDTNGGFIRYDK